MPALIDISGQTFGRVTVLSRDGSICGEAAWRCRCVCKKEFVTSGKCLRTGRTKSCGCYQSESISRANRKHGHSTRLHGQTRTYKIWGGMINRCKNPRHISYKWYGLVGVTVCDRWKDFQNFLADMGEAPAGLSIDRYSNTSGNYEPGNCRWATWSDQNLNKRKSKKASATPIRQPRALPPLFPSLFPPARILPPLFNFEVPSHV